MKGHDLKDSLLRDAADMQRQRGVMPDTKADEAEWTAQLQAFEMRQAEAKPAPKKKPQEPEARAKSSAQIAENGGRVLTQAEVLAAEQARARSVRVLTQKQRFDALMAKRRLALLMTKPEWAAKVKKAWCDGYDFARKNGLNTSVMQGTYVGRVLDESSAAFGEWDKVPARKILVGAK